MSASFLSYGKLCGTRVARHPAYLSEAWITAARRRVESMENLSTTVGDVSLSLLMVVTDRPGLDGEAVYIRFDRGELAEVEAGPRDTLERQFSNAEFVVWGTYETFAELHAGRLTEKLAVLSGRVRLKGSMFRALKLLKVVERLNTVLRREPARY